LATFNKPTVSRRRYFSDFISSSNAVYSVRSIEDGDVPPLACAFSHGTSSLPQARREVIYEHLM